MLDILSTAELTISASIAVVFLSLTMAQTAGGRARRSARARRMVRAGSGDRRDRRARPRWWRRAGARPDGRFAHRGARLGLFRLALCAKCDGRDALAGAHRPPCDPPARIQFHHSLRRGPASRPVCAERGMGRRVHGRDRAAARLGGCAIRSPVRPLVLLWNALGVADLVIAITPWDAVGARSASGFRRTARRFANDHFALAHHSGLSRARLLFRARRDLRPAREGGKREADAQLAKRASGESGVTGTP